MDSPSAAVEEILAEREARGLLIPTYARLALALFVVATHIYSLLYQGLDIGLVGGIVAVSLLFCAVNGYFLSLLRRRRHVVVVGVAGAVMDVAMFAGLALTLGGIFDSLGRTTGYLFLSPIPAAAMLFLTVNAMTLRPRYPAIVGVGTVLLLGGMLASALTDDRTRWSDDLAEAYAASSTLEPLNIFIIVVMAMAVVPTSFAIARTARQTVRDAAVAQLEVERLAKDQIALVMREKMNALGKLVAGISHEINSPLGAIQSSLDTLDRALEKAAAALPESDETGKAHRAIGVAKKTGAIVREGAERIAQTEKALRAFAHLDEAAFQEVSFNTEIERVIEILPVGVRGEKKLELELGELPSVHVQVHELSELLNTIVTHAFEAIDDDGCVGIETRHVDGAVEVAVSDTGDGMDEVELSALFDVSLKAKGSRVAAGLGLATAQQIALRHDGTLEVASTVGEGTTFTLRIPTHSTVSSA